VWIGDAITDFFCGIPRRYSDIRAVGGAHHATEAWGHTIPFTDAPCYPYELASKNKPPGEK
jgi:hypothetical protein